MKLVDRILQDATASYYSIHGISHWQNVEKFAIYIAKYEKVNLRVLQAFAYLHDCKRENNDYDPFHGPRAADYIEQSAHEWLELTDTEIRQLATACRYHTADKYFDDLTILACYDCDRLDLPRSGIIVDTNFLYTETAKRIVREGIVV